MSKLALVIGSEVLGLRGTENDACEVRDALARRGFSVELRLGERASRAGILEGLRVLTEAARPGDCAVVYYAGHGAYTRSPELGNRRRFQALVPTDWEKTTLDDYRGISTWELSCNLHRLTGKTRNAVLILDCCHSAQLCRTGEERRARALPDPSVTGFAAHVQALQAIYGEIPDVVKPGWGNPDLVRLVACGRAEAAHEMVNERGVWRGVFTEALLQLLHQAPDDSLSWELLAQGVRQRVLRRLPEQRPDLEGPRRRRLFSLLEDDGSGHTMISATSRGLPGVVSLHEGRLHGVSVNDVYSVMPPGSAQIEDDREIARAVVAAAAGTTSEALIQEWRNGHAALPEGAVAIPRQRAARRRPVTLIAPAHQLPKIEQALAAAGTLRPASPAGAASATGADGAAGGAGAAGDEPPLATLRLAGDQLTVEDERGPLFPPWSYPRDLHAAVAPLGDLATARGLRELEGAHGLSARKLTIELGALLDGAYVRLPDRGATLGRRDRIFVRVRNGGQERVYVHVFNLGLRGDISQMTAFAPSGLVLEPRDEYVLGQGEATDTFEGLELVWPNGLPVGGGPRLDELIVIATSHPTSLHALERRRGEPSAAKQEGGLYDLLVQLQDGETRDVSHADPDGFLVKSLSFWIDPRETSLALTAAARAAADGARAAGDES